MSTLVYESKAAYDTWLKIVLAFPPVLLIIETYFLARESTEDLLIMIATLAFLSIIYYLVLPRGYRIYNDKVAVLLGQPCSFSINFATIKSADRLKGIGFGVNYAGSGRNTITLHRKKRMDVNIAPVDPDIFLSNLEKALQEWKKYYDQTG
jgi:hypothetical protein